jgi:hypothetical protein
VRLCVHPTKEHVEEPDEMAPDDLPGPDRSRADRRHRRRTQRAHRDRSAHRTNATADGRRPSRPRARAEEPARGWGCNGRWPINAFRVGRSWRRSRPRKPPPPWTGRIQGGGLPPCGCDGCRRSPGIEVLGELPLPGLRRSGHRAQVGVAWCRGLWSRGLACAPVAGLNWAPGSRHSLPAARLATASCPARRTRERDDGASQRSMRRARPSPPRCPSQASTSYQRP